MIVGVPDDRIGATFDVIERAARQIEEQRTLFL